MDFSHPEERQMLIDSVGRYFTERYPIETRHAISRSEAGWSVEHWQALAELGIPGVLFSESAGGFGGGGFDIGAVFEQLGHALVVEPFLGLLMAGRVLAASGGSEALLAEAIGGTRMLAFAHEEPHSHYDLVAIGTRAEHASNGWMVSGHKAVVPQIEAADYIVLSARTSGSHCDETGIALFRIDKGQAGIKVRGYPMIDGGRGGELILNKVQATLITEAGFPLIEHTVAAGIVALSWEAVGVMDVLKDATLDYLRTRRQFGVPIGKFQALQHRMATLALEIEQARSAAINAAAALDGDRNTRERAVSAAKYTIGHVGTLVAEEAIQMHGAIGMTWELPLSHYAKRLTMINHQLGDEDHHLERFMLLSRLAI
jgi:alkylation response protein AidB-like acyl-CoA dehydrogenase